MPKLSYCADQLRRFDHDRFLCSLFVPSEARDAVQAIFSFNLELARIPEMVREPLAGQMRHQFWRDTLEAIDAGRPPRHPVAAALATAKQGFGFERDDLERILDARARDLEATPPATLTDLLTYVDATAGTLSQLSLTILGVHDQASRWAAMDAATAFGLLGLLRAIPTYRRYRRTVLPVEVNRAAGLDVQQLYERGPTDGLAAAVESVAAAAALRLDAARSARPSVARGALPALLPATLADLSLGRLRRAGFDPFRAEVAQIPVPIRMARLAAAALTNRY